MDFVMDGTLYILIPEERAFQSISESISGKSHLNAFIYDVATTH
jgi:hypothetical protein